MQNTYAISHTSEIAHPVYPKRADRQLGGAAVAQITISGLKIEYDLVGKPALAAGSGGSRVALIAAARDPEIVSHLVVWWVSGGVTGLISLAYYYCVTQAIAASKGGMAAVAALPAWEELLRTLAVCSRPAAAPPSMRRTVLSWEVR
jgi:hypothetical protein